MSGASGQVPAAIHVTPEALAEGMIGKIEDGDVLCLDAEAGTLHLDVSEDILKNARCQTYRKSRTQG